MGSQVDVNWDFNADIGTASYSMIQALPQFGPLNLYPLAGLGAVVQDEKAGGYTVPGSFGIVGVYSKLEVSENIWINYNPMYSSQFGGNDALTQADMFGWAHEAAVSYQLDPRQNVRLFWNRGDSLDGTEFRAEYNRQF